ncbi:hypothetical protein D3C76_1222230 [compost metagenome]
MVRGRNGRQCGVGIGQAQRIRGTPGLPGIFCATGQHLVVRITGVSQKCQCAAFARGYDGGLQRILATADTEFIQHLTVVADVEIFGKLAEKLVINRQSYGSVSVKHRRVAHQGADIEEWRGHQLLRSRPVGAEIVRVGGIDGAAGPTAERYRNVEQP